VIKHIMRRLPVVAAASTAAAAVPVTVPGM
jgi:hypothetical protein